MAKHPTQLCVYSLKSIQLPAILKLIFLLVTLHTPDGITRVQDGVSTNPPPEIVEGLEVYRDFDQLDYLFRMQNDTIYVINFWATWCKPCVEELPFFEQLHQDYSGLPVRIILVSLDFEQQIGSRLVPFMEKRDLRPEVKVLLDSDANAWIPRVDPEWGGAIPVTLVYRDTQRNFFNGPFDSYDQLRGIVDHFYHH